MPYFIGWILGVATMLPVIFHLRNGLLQTQREKAELSKKNGDLTFLMHDRAMSD